MVDFKCKDLTFCHAFFNKETKKLTANMVLATTWSSSMST